MVDEPRDEPIVFDINQWAALEEQSKQGMGILVPATQEELEHRRPLITRTSGPSPNIYLTFQVKTETEILLAWRERRKVDWEGLQMIETILDLNMSNRGWRADAVRDMHMMAPKPVPPRSLAERFFGGK